MTNLFNLWIMRKPKEQVIVGTVLFCFFFKHIIFIFWQT